MKAFTSLRSVEQRQSKQLTEAGEAAVTDDHKPPESESGASWEGSEGSGEKNRQLHNHFRTA